MVRVSQSGVPKTVRGAVRTRWERALKCSAPLINEQLTPVQKKAEGYQGSQRGSQGSKVRS